MECLIKFLVFSIFILAIFYVYFVQNSVVGIIDRDRTEEKILKLSGEISELESKYLSVRGAVNMKVAYKMGFKEDFNRINFANANVGKFSNRLSYLENEI